MLSSVASLKMHVMLISQSVIHVIKQKKQLWLHRNDFSCPRYPDESFNCTNEKLRNSLYHISSSNHSN